MERNQLLIIGLEGLTAHKVRSVLTMLGVIFGVGAVIAMLSVGEGAKQEALEKYKTLGVNNIIVRDKNLSEKELEEVRAKFSQGLNLKDAQAIQSIVPSVETLAPQSELESEAKFQDKSVKVTLVGVTPEFRELLNYFPDRGEFLTEDHYNRDMRVCILGAEVAKSLFPIGDPIGQQVKLHDQWFEVIGTMGVKTLFTETVGELAARNLNQDVYIPLSSLLRRFTKEEQLDSQLDQLTLRIRESSELMESAAIIRRVMSRRHFGNDDFDLVIPYELLLQEEKERRIYNMVLGSIAAISLLVGGIGIMNIMLATVLERTREIGVRRALGATRKDILMQFLIEAVGLSLVGGLIGVTLGVSMSWIIDAIAEFQTIVSTVSVLVAFVVSGTVGVVAGTVPAKRAAAINPIDALRFE